MPVYDISFIALSDSSTSNPGAIGNPSGGGWAIGSDWINLSSGATIETISVNDDDGGFGDDDFSQTLAGGRTLNGAWYGNGTMVENEYLLTVEDSLGNQYQLAAFGVQNEGNNIRGFSYVGQQPPLGENLTIVAVQDSANMSYTPTCFTPGTRIATPDGPIAVERLAPGDLVCTLDAGPQPLRMVLRRRVALARGPCPERPIHIARNSLAPGQPKRDLALSPQHRVLVRDDGGDWLVPAKALAPEPGGPAGEVTSLHLVFDRHQLVFAEDLTCESFWPGPVAMAGLAPVLQLAVVAAMPAPRPARPFLAPGAYRRRLARRVPA
jgi:hypothetical protein